MVSNELKAAVKAEIDMTNNGKLMLVNVPANLRQAVKDLLAEGFLCHATFLTCGDSIRVA